MTSVDPFMPPQVADSGKPFAAHTTHMPPGLVRTRCVIPVATTVTIRSGRLGKRSLHDPSVGVQQVNFQTPELAESCRTVLACERSVQGRCGSGDSSRGPGLLSGLVEGWMPSVTIPVADRGCSEVILQQEGPV